MTLRKRNAVCLPCLSFRNGAAYQSVQVRRLNERVSRVSMQLQLHLKREVDRISCRFIPRISRNGHKARLTSSGTEDNFGGKKNYEQNIRECRIHPHFSNFINTRDTVAAENRRDWTERKKICED